MSTRLFSATLLAALLGVISAGILSCHLTESQDDVLVLTLNDSLRAYAKVEVLILDITGTQTFAELWNEALPNPANFRYKLDKQSDHQFLVRVIARDGAGTVKLIKTLTWKEGKQQPGVHVVNGAAPTFTVAGLRVSEADDKDGDGFARTYQVILDVDGNTNLDILAAKILYQVEGNTAWLPLAERPAFEVRGQGRGDSIVFSVEGGAHRLVNLKAEVSFGGALAATSLESKGIKEEAAAQDAPGLKWSLRNFTGAVLKVTGQVGGTSFSNRTLTRGEAIEITLATKAAGEKIGYRAVADGPGDAVVFSDTTSMAMDLGEKPDTLKARPEYFALNLQNGSGKTITRIILYRASDTLRYEVGVPSLGGEYRNLGLFPYQPATGLGLGYDGIEKEMVRGLNFGTHTVQGYRFADFDFK